MPKIDPKNLKVGSSHMVTHRRFGTAVVRILSIGETFIETEVEEGTLRGINQGWGPGAKKSLRIEHCTFSQ